MVMYKPLYTPEEVAEVACCSAEKIRQMIRTGELKAIIFGTRGHRIRGSDLEEYIENLKPDTSGRERK